MTGSKCKIDYFANENDLQTRVGGSIFNLNDEPNIVYTNYPVHLGYDNNDRPIPKPRKDTWSHVFVVKVGE